ncbi:MAG TPA: hypothetical protein VFC90_00925 [Planctomycetota bacterium]|nr:hypothetical protein [Planctomycetota bacterium]
MNPVRWVAAAAVLLVGAQEPILQVRAVTKDGQTLIGTPSIASVQIEGGFGIVEIKLKDLLKVVIEGESVAAFGQDGSSLKGKMKLEALKLKSLLGEVTLKPGALKEFGIQHVYPGMYQPSTKAEKEHIVLAVRTQDGNDLVGTTDLSSIRIESTLGKFDVDIRCVNTFGKGKAFHQIFLLDGSDIRGTAQVPEFKVRTKFGEFAIKPDALASLALREIRAPDPRQPLPPAVPPGKPAPAPPAPSSTPAIQPIGKIAVKSVLGEFRVSKDGKKLYALNLSEAKLLRWRLPGLEEDGAVAVVGVEKAVALSPSGTRIFAVGQKTVSILSVEPLALQKSFSVEVGMEDVCAVDEDTILTAGQGVVSISISKTAVTQKFNFSGPDRIRMSPNGDRAYCGDGLFAINRNAGGRVRIETMVLPRGMGVAPASMSMSSDGRFACSSSPDSRVYRLGRCWAASCTPLAPVDKHLVSAFSPDGSKLLLFTDEGFLKIYDTVDFKLQASHRLGVRAYQAVLDADGKSVTLAAAPEDASTARMGYDPQAKQGVVVDLYRFEIPK